MTKKKIKPIRIAVHRDASNNELQIEHFPAHANIKLKLASEKRSRVLGVLDFASRTLNVFRQRQAHLFRKMNAYGLNHHLLKEAKLIDQVRLTDDTEEWLIPRDFILQNGKFLNFSNHGGFELQIFMPLNSIQQFLKKPTI